MMMMLCINQQRKRPLSFSGFTFIELVIVILLLAIISVYASSKYMGNSRFSSVVAQEQVVSILRQVQIAAMQANTMNRDACRVIHFSSDGFGVSSSCKDQGMESAVLADYSKSHDQHQLEMIQLSYAMTSTGTSVSELSFDLLGRPISFNGSSSLSLCTAADCRITITTPSSNEKRSVCINGEGFIYRSNQGSGCVL